MPYTTCSALCTCLDLVYLAAMIEGYVFNYSRCCTFSSRLAMGVRPLFMRPYRLKVSLASVRCFMTFSARCAAASSRM